MALGESGGRSAGNRDGEGARRRNTQRERAYIDPPLDQLVSIEEKPTRYRLTPRGERVVSFGVWATYVAMLATLVFILGCWFGVWLS